MKIIAELLIVIAIVVVASTMTHSQEATPSIEILSKEDARAVFGMSKEEWVANVRHAVSAGQARATGSPEVDFGMGIDTPDGDVLMVMPSYGDDLQRPDFIQVVVGYRPPRAALLTDKMLEDAIKAANSQMAPEYEVMGHFDHPAGGTAIYFVITEAGD